MFKKLEKGFKYNNGFYIKEKNDEVHIIVPHVET